MTMPSPLQRELRFKEAGQARAASAHMDEIIRAREFAATFCREDRARFCLDDKGRPRYISRATGQPLHCVVTMDDIRQAQDITPAGAGSGKVRSVNSWLGSVFKSGFTFTGDWARSAYKGSHGREIKIWRAL